MTSELILLFLFKNLSSSDKNFVPNLNDGWMLYHEPFKINKGYLYIKSTRLGYKDSEIIKIEL